LWSFLTFVRGSQEANNSNLMAKEIDGDTNREEYAIGKSASGYIWVEAMHATIYLLNRSPARGVKEPHSEVAWIGG
jgi:hypothetical protein